MKTNSKSNISDNNIPSEQVDIIIACYDIGGAKSIFPVYEMLANNYSNIVICSEVSKSVFDNPDFIFDNSESYSDLSLIIRRFHPKIILTGTSEFSNLERFCWNIAKDLRIQSIALIDSWTNIAQRFFYYSNEALKDKFSCPDLILVPDRYVKDYLIKEDWCRSKISICGQPHLEKNIELLSKLRMKKKSKKGVFLYLSEPVIEKREQLSIGYTQFSVADKLIKELSNYHIKQIIIKPHPKEDIDNWNNWKEKLPFNIKKKIKIASDEIEKLADSCECVIGMASMALLEFGLSGFPTIAFQPNRNYIPNIMIDKCEQIKLVIKDEDFIKILNLYSKNDINKFDDTKSPFLNSSTRVIKIIKQLLIT